MTTLVTETIYFDAVLAEKYLENNRWHQIGVKGTNRKVSRRTVTKFAIAMADGRWLETHQGIALNDRNEIEDGQHRLLAVIEADKLRPGIVIAMRVTRGVSPETFKVLDSGLRRSPGNVASSSGYANSFQAGATAKLFNSYMNVPFEFASSWTSPVQWDSSMIPDVLDTYPSIVDAVQRVANKRFTGNATAISTGISLAMELRPDTDVEKFAWRLETGLDVRDGEPAYMLREKLGVMQRTGHSDKQMLQLAFFVKAYNKYILGEDMLAFRWNPIRDEFPRIIAASAELEGE